MLKLFVNLIKLSAKPATIIYPYPIAALLAFSLSGTLNVIYLIKAIAFSFIFYAGVNLWNHVNDVEEDIKGGKKTIITENPKIRKLTALISAVLYVTSFVLAFIWIVDWRGIAAFVPAALATWIYSDKIFFGKKIRRWKDHYITEILAFIIFFPAFFSMLWTIFAPLSLRGLAFSMTMTLFMFSGAFLKDLKDITGDRLAGLKTLGVVFSPETLLKASSTMLIFYYFSIVIFSYLELLPFASFFSVVFFFGFGYTLSHFYTENWKVSGKSIKPLEVMYYSNLGSLLMLIFSGFT
jgi:1,4-dihydroxy-2-naphthoate octaprenyltransferase